VVIAMSLFSKISLISIKENDSRDQLKSKFIKKSMTLTNYASYYLVYVLNIITNQGKNEIYVVVLIYR
jgi:hypothetical protein